MNNFICPCCGYEAKWSQEIAVQIKKAVFDFFDMNKEEFEKIRTSHQTIYGIQLMAWMYYVSVYTGEPQKNIAYSLGFHPSTIGTKIIAAYRWLSDREDFRLRLEEYIAEELAIKKLKIV